MFTSRFGRVILLNSLLLLPLLLKSQTTQTLVLSPDKDTYIRICSAYPAWTTTNYGTYGQLWAKKWTWSGSWGTFRSLISFAGISQIPENATIVSATLFLGGINHYEGNAGVAENSTYVCRVTQDWTETNATWTSMSAYYTDDGRYTIPATPTTDFDYDVTLDMTDMVQNWVNGTYENYGFMLRLVNESVNSYRSFYVASKEYSVETKWPKLTIVFYVDGTDMVHPIDLGTLSNAQSVTDTKSNCPANCFGDNYGIYDATNNQATDDIFYKFTLTNSDEVVIKTCGSEHYNTYLHILNSSGTVIANNDESDNCNNYHLSYYRGTLAAGTYYAVVEGVDGSTCNSITTTLVNPPEFTTQPVNVSACVGSTATFSVTPNSTFDSYQWEMSPNGGSTWTEYGGSSTNSTIDWVNQSMTNYVFRCKGIFSDEIVTSSNAVLYVTNNPTVTIDKSFEETKELTLDILPDKDAIVSSSAPTSKYGRAGTAFKAFSSSTTIERSFIEIDLNTIPKNAQINSAKLKLGGVYHYEGNSSYLENSFFVSRITEPWEEYEITWNIQPTVSTALGTDRLTMAATPVGDYDYDYEIDITYFVNNWLAGTYPNYGLAFQLVTESGDRSLYFATSDYTVDPDKRPKLTITYIIPTKPWCIDILQPTLSGASSYSWTPTTGLSCSNCSSPLITMNSGGDNIFYITATNASGCSSIYNYDFYRCNTIYGELSENIDGSYYIVKKGCLFFKFKEDYVVPANTHLDYTIYNDQMVSVTTGTFDNDLVKMGTNLYTYDVNSILTYGNYLLEVTNSKNEKFYLKFHYIN